MNTSTAATKANVTTATIRTWARYGAITATKTNGRWDIDEASLTRRIALTAKPAKPLTAEAVIALGGSRWTKNNMDRIYLNGWAEYAGIEVTHYGTGNVSGAWIGGRGVANGRIGRILGTVEKVYFDCADSKLYVKHHGARDIEVRFLDGAYERLDLVELICDGVRSAAAAL